MRMVASLREDRLLEAANAASETLPKGTRLACVMFFRTGVEAEFKHNGETYMGKTKMSAASLRKATPETLGRKLGKLFTKAVEAGKLVEFPGTTTL